MEGKRERISPSLQLGMQRRSSSRRVLTLEADLRGCYRDWVDERRECALRTDEGRGGGNCAEGGATQQTQCETMNERYNNPQ